MTTSITTAQALPLTVSLASGAAITGIPSWSSDTPSVATVTASANGLTADVYPVAAGSANITVSLSGELPATTSVVVATNSEGQLVITIGTPVPYTPPVTTPPTNTPPPAGTLVIGTALAGLAAGATLNIPAGTYTGNPGATGAISAANSTVNGAGMGETILNGYGGTEPYQNNSALEVTASGVTISNLTIQDWTISTALGENAGGVRNGTGTTNITLSAVEITGCDSGIGPTNGGSWTVNGCNIHVNGNSDPASGDAHDSYFNSSAATDVTTITNSTFSGSSSGHEVKCRTPLLNITNSTLTSAGIGHCIDMCDGGTVNVTGSTLTIVGTSANDQTYIAHGAEGNTNPTVPQVVTFTNTVFVAPAGSTGFINGNIGNSTINFVGCTYKGGSGPPSVKGFTTVTGTVTAAA